MVASMPADRILAAIATPEWRRPRWTNDIRLPWWDLVTYFSHVFRAERALKRAEKLAKDQAEALRVAENRLFNTKRLAREVARNLGIGDTVAAAKHADAMMAYLTAPGSE